MCSFEQGYLMNVYVVHLNISRVKENPRKAGGLLERLAYGRPHHFCDLRRIHRDASEGSESGRVANIFARPTLGPVAAPASVGRIDI
jgi:hypothetical protein